MDRSEKIRRIMKDITNNVAGYHDFIMDCVQQTLETWNDEQLNDYYLQFQYTWLDIEDE